jgi:transaldolase
MRSRSRATGTAARRSAPSPWAVRSAIPGPSGSPAIEALTAAGVNANFTLRFSVERYEQVIEAYIRGLERRLATGQPLDSLASVASFFVSRVDAKADALLPADSDLRGRVAFANAQRAYARYHRRFADDRWRTLADAGAQAATAAGEHRDQGPGLLRRALRRAADRTRSHQHDA